MGKCISVFYGSKEMNYIADVLSIFAELPREITLMLATALALSCLSLIDISLTRYYSNSVFVSFICMGASIYDVVFYNDIFSKLTAGIAIVLFALLFYPPTNCAFMFIILVKMTGRRNELIGYRMLFVSLFILLVALHWFLLSAAHWMDAVPTGR